MKNKKKSIAKEALDNIETVDAILDDIPVIFLKLKKIKIKAKKRKLKVDMKWLKKYEKKSWTFKEIF